jgi:hypothetical protein
MAAHLVCVFKGVNVSLSLIVIRSVLGIVLGTARYQVISAVLGIVLPPG